LRHTAKRGIFAMLNDEEKLKIKAQTKLAIRDCGGQEAAVEATGRLERHQSLSDYGNAQMLNKYICIDSAIELDRFSGNARFAKLFASMNGGIFVPLPKGTAKGCLEIAAGKTAVEFGDVMVSLGAAIKDGEINQLEALDTVREIKEAMVALAGLAEEVKSKAKK